MREYKLGALVKVVEVDTGLGGLRKYEGHVGTVIDINKNADGYINEVWLKFDRRGFLDEVFYPHADILEVVFTEKPRLKWRV